MEELRLQLVNNKLQLQQVEASLELDKDNEELKKLQVDLMEVIRLTQELMGEDATTEESSWKVGDTCMARCTRDKLFYKATILEVLANGSCVVNFVDYDTTDICQVIAFSIYCILLYGNLCVLIFRLDGEVGV